jgi:hypothetical protein
MTISSDNLVTTFKKSGLTQKGFCKTNGIALERLRYHLYKKNRRKYNSKNDIQKNKSAHTFISFNKPGYTPPKTDQNSFNTYTIIHGKFTYNQLAKLAKELGSASC